MKPDTAHVKGTDLVIMKTLITQKGDPSLSVFSNSLTPETQAVFNSLMPTNWVSNKVATEIMEKTAKVFFPGQRDDLEQLGRICADRAFNGIYKAFLRITSLSFLLKRVPLVWNMYHSVGKAEITLADEKTGATLVVKGAPDVSVSNLRLVSGFSMQALEMAGAKNISCQLNTQDPSNWQWVFRWLA